MAPYEYARGLTEWMRGEDSASAEAAGILTAETMIRIRLYLEAQAKES